MLEARALGDPPPKVTWFHNDLPIRSSMSLQLIEDGDWHRLVIPRVELSHHGDYCILATNEGGEARSICNLAVSEPPPPPKPQPSYLTQRTEVVEEFSSESHLTAPHGTPPQFKLFFPASYRAPLGSKVKMDCHLVGNPRPKVTWTFNGQPIPSSFVQLSNIGDTYAVIIPEVRREHQGVYTLRGVNEMGVAESSASLIVEGTPAPPAYVSFLSFLPFIIILSSMKYDYSATNTTALD